VALQRVSAFLEMEVAKRWSPLVAAEPAPNHPAIGAGESDLGTGSNRRRTTRQVRNPSLAQDREIVACDFFVSVSATFRVFYVFVAMEIGSRRILHINVTDHPTAEWTIQQFREFLAYYHPYQFVIHDRDSIFSRSADQALKDCGSARSKHQSEHPRRWDGSPGKCGN
jgi:hypothetical protein